MSIKDRLRRLEGKTGTGTRREAFMRDGVPWVRWICGAWALEFPQEKPTAEEWEAKFAPKA